MIDLDTIPRIDLAHFPTPLEEAPRLAREIGLNRLLIKRDDSTSLGSGGNKVRKLEFLMADALAKGADTIMTLGGIQSNHARLTAAAARKVGIPRVILVLGGPWDGLWQGNLMLNIVLGAEMKILKDAGVKEIIAEGDRISQELRKQGHTPYLIPMGGSCPTGALGYVFAMREIAEQLGSDADPLIVTAVGSGGTMAGCVLGTKLFLPKAEVLGVSVAGMAGYTKTHACEVVNETARNLDVNLILSEDDFNINQDYFSPKYAVPSEAGNEAILIAGRTEGIILDPVYTGKAMSGLIDLAHKKAISPDRTVIFIHTGGSPALMGYEEQMKVYRKEYVQG